ncbi:unnamed protein product, partial [Protopolystoma xenopodis]
MQYNDIHPSSSGEIGQRLSSSFIFIRTESPPNNQPLINPMVVLALKKGDLTHFLYEASSSIHISSLVSEICQIYNGRLKILRIIDHISELSAHGLSLPPEMQGLTDEQISELKLIDEWGEKCIPSGGFIYNRDDLGRRNGKAPNKNMVDVLKRTQDEAKSLISMDLVKKSKPLKMVDINEAIMMLNGALTIVYPMGLPPHEPIRMEFDNIEDLSGTQASMEVIPPNECTLWFCGKEMLSAKCLFDY